MVGRLNGPAATACPTIRRVRHLRHGSGRLPCLARCPRRSIFCAWNTVDLEGIAAVAARRLRGATS